MLYLLFGDLLQTCKKKLGSFWIKAAGMSGTTEKRNVFSVRKPDHENTKTTKYKAPGRPRSSRSIIWKGHSIFYNFNASTIAETYQRSIFLTFKGQTTKTQKWPNTEPQGVPEALDRFFRKLIQFSTISVENNIILTTFSHIRRHFDDCFAHWT